MTFALLKERIKACALEAVRQETDAYLEAVIAVDAAQRLIEPLESLFGRNNHLVADSVSEVSRTLLEPFGGIQPGQSLFCSQEGSQFIFAMFWPWQDKKRVTLKAGSVKLA